MLGEQIQQKFHRSNNNKREMQILKEKHNFSL